MDFDIPKIAWEDYKYCKNCGSELSEVTRSSFNIKTGEKEYKVVGKACPKRILGFLPCDFFTRKGFWG